MTKLPAIWPGKDGFLLLRYEGKAPTERDWYGLETGVCYPFGPGTERYVDRLDGLRWIRNHRENQVFRIVSDD